MSPFLGLILQPSLAISMLFFTQQRQHKDSDASRSTDLWGESASTVKFRLERLQIKQDINNIFKGKVPVFIL